MGKLEKIVVVTVLFLVAVILGVSLNSGSGETGKGPATASGNGKAGKVRPNADGSAAGAAGDLEPKGLLNATVDPSAPAGEANRAASSQGALQPSTTPAAQPAAPDTIPAVNPPANPAVVQPQVPAGSLLVTRVGLEPTALEDLMTYTWQAGDSLARVSERYYGSPLHVQRLRKVNEGLDETKLAPGAKILVPALASALGGAAPRAAQPAVAAAETKWAGGLYEVKSGDVLGTISQKVYGTSKKWKKIFDANRDVIGDDPNRLTVGSKLRIPE